MTVKHALRLIQTDLLNTKKQPKTMVRFRLPLVETVGFEPTTSRM